MANMALDNGEWQWLDNPDENGLTPLHLVARSGWRCGAQLLLQANASTEARDGQDFTPLMTAVMYKQKDIVQLLLESKSGVDVNATSHWDGPTAHLNYTPSTPLHLAAFVDEPTLTKMLLDKGAVPSINARTKKGSPLGNCSY
jgi:ankyrin repeat protein